MDTWTHEPIHSGLEFCNHYFSALAVEKTADLQARSAALGAALRPAIFEKSMKTVTVRKTFVESSLGGSHSDPETRFYKCLLTAEFPLGFSKIAGLEARLE